MSKSVFTYCAEHLVWKFNWASKEKKAFRKLFGKSRMKNMVEDHSLKVLYINFSSEDQLNTHLNSIVNENDPDFLIISSGTETLQVDGFKFIASHNCDENPIRYKYFIINFSHLA